MKKLIVVILSLMLLCGCANNLSNNRIKMPNVTGLDEQSARQILIKEGFYPCVEYSYWSNVEKGYVVYCIEDMSTWHTDGTYDRGTKVEVVISLGPWPY